MENQEKKKSPLRFIIIGVVLAVVVGGGLIYWLAGANYETTDNAQVDGDIVSIRSSVTAYVKEIHFKDNDRVHKGDTLIVLDTIELSAKVAQAKAALENSKANLHLAGNRATASVENANAAVLTSQSYEQNVISTKANLDKAQTQFDRVSNLVKIKAATQEQFESAQATLVVAKADYARAVEQKKSSETSSLGLKAQSNAERDQIDLAGALIKQREAELLLAKEQLSHAYVVSPFTGIVTKRSVQVGQFISTGQALCSVVDVEHVWVTANFKETQLEKIKPGQEVKIEIDAYPGLKITGKVDSYSGATGARFALLPPDNATGNFIKVTQRFPIRIALDKIADEGKDLLYPGLSAFVKVKVK